MLDFNIFRHFDGQGGNNSVIIYITRHLNVHILAITHLISSIFVLIFICNNEPTYSI